MGKCKDKTKKECCNCKNWLSEGEINHDGEKICYGVCDVFGRGDLQFGSQRICQNYDKNTGETSKPGKQGEIGTRKEWRLFNVSDLKISWFKGPIPRRNEYIQDLDGNVYVVERVKYHQIKDQEIGEFTTDVYARFVCFAGDDDYV